MSRLRLLLLLLVVFLLPQRIQAQTETPTPEPSSGAPIPQIHTVQEGENLTIIASTYGVTIEDLLALNGLTEDAVLSIGQTLVVPGGEGDAVATLYTVQAGDTLAQVAAVFNTTPRAILETNRIINARYRPVVGQTLSVVSRTGSALPQPVTGTPHIVAAGESLLAIAARYRVSPAILAAENDLSFPTYLFPGQRLRIPGQEAYRFLTGEWTDVAVRPLPLLPGTTAVVTVQNMLEGQPAGQFAGQPLHFVLYEDGFLALMGLDAFAEPGLYELVLTGTGERPWRPFRQQVQVNAGDYIIQQIVVSEELNALLTPDVRAEEDAFLEPIYKTFTAEQHWHGRFQYPITNPVVTARYGDGRSYNGGPVEIFHTGTDFAGGLGTPVMATAEGTVVFSDFLTLRGISIIDHGLGVMTAYNHLSEQFVTTGEHVTTGQLIGSIGSTGLSTGPHLHWEVRILNVPVNGLEWIEQGFP
jgi:murein DD-endopeptidase MepM/ murein hydrolase activator NlpD